MVLIACDFPHDVFFRLVMESVMDRKCRVFRFGEYEVSERDLRVARAGETLALEPRALRVLLYLVRNPGRLVTKDELLSAVWADTAVTENSLSRVVGCSGKCWTTTPASRGSSPRFQRRATGSSAPSRSATACCPQWLRLTGQMAKWAMVRLR